MTKIIPYTQDELKTLFEYNNGGLYWRVCFGRRKKNTQAGCKRKDGYKIIRINGAQYLSHRLIFKLIHNQEPEYIDHIDQNPSNNNIENLRPINQSHNLHNTGLRSTNTSGVKGVGWHKKGDKWRVRIVIDYQEAHLGFTNDFFEACCLRKSAELRCFPEIYKI